MQLQQVVCAVVIAAGTIALVTAQNGPFPPRLSIPGALPVPVQQSRPVVRIRRPIALRNPLPAVTPRFVEDSKPVTEAPEDEAPDVYLPTLLREQQQQQFHQAAAAFLNNEANSIGESQYVQLLNNEEQTVTAVPATRFVERPTISQSRPAFNDYGIGSGIVSSQRFGIERQQSQQPAPQQQQQPAPLPQRVNVIRSRPQQRPHYEPQAAPAPAPTPAPQRPRPKPIQSRPLIDQNQLQDERDAQQQRRQRPVAQTIRKWRDENDDGSITWGYENDDGSFKEELIGTDCITKGTYGYIDPDGNKREYHYETGIKCDPNAREAEQELDENGFINYEENKAVLPNGLEIDMSQLGKKKSNRPAVNYRN